MVSVNRRGNDSSQQQLQVQQPQHRISQQQQPHWARNAVPYSCTPGALEMEELPKILAEFDVEYDEKRLPDMFNIYDVDR